MTLPERSRALPAIVAVAAVAVYANSLLNGFALDDVFIVQGNPRVHSPASMADIWLTPYWRLTGAALGLYRPGIIFFYAVQWVAGAGEPWLFHAVSVALHAAASVLVFVLLRRLADPVPAFVGALLFAVHPIHTEAVANIVGQAEIVAAIAVLAACIVHSGRPQGLAVSWPRRIVISVLFALALVTKESAVVLPALLVIVDFAQRRVQPTARGIASHADAMLMPLFLLAATLALYLIVRYDVMGGALIGVNAAPAMPYLREEYRILNALRVFPEFIRLLFLPLDLAADYSPAAILPVETVRPLVVLGALLLMGLVALSLLTPWLPKAGFPAAWFLISILTVSNLFFPIGVLIAERTLYLPSVAVSALAAFAWQALQPGLDSAGRRRLVLICATVIIAFGVRTWIRNPVWASTDTVWAAMMRDQPQSYRTQWLYAIKLWGANRLPEAATRFEFAYRLYDRDSQLLTEYANLMMAQGRFSDALLMLERAQHMNPGIVRNSSTLMHAYLATGRYRRAIETAVHARRSGAPPSTTMPVRAFAYQQMGNFSEAVAAWRLAIAYSHDTAWQLHGHLARNLAAAGFADDAIAALDSARPAAPDTTAEAVLTSVRRAVVDGCYRDRAIALRADASLPLPPSRPFGIECDDLGHWFAYTVAGQNANVSQNASPGASPAPATAPANIP
jgi:tetratricopeptide (TPR) repeat protein